MIKTITVSTETRKLVLGDILTNGLGVINDNEIDTLYFKFDTMLDGVGTLLTDIQGQDGVLAPFSLTKVSDGYKLTLTDEIMVQERVEIQLMVTMSDVVWHSKKYILDVLACLETGTGTTPSGVTTWLAEANEKLEEFEEALETISAKEDKSNKVTSISSSSTDTQYASAKAVYTSINATNTRVSNLEHLVIDGNVEKAIANYFALTPDFNTYGVKWYKFDTSTSPNCTKYGANANLSITPATDTVAEVSNYPTAWDSIDVNAFVDNDGIRHITAVKGMSNFGDTEDTIPTYTYNGTTYLQDVFVLKRTYYQKWYTDDDGMQCLERRFVPTDGYTVTPLAKNKDGSISPYFIIAKYVCGYDSQNRYRSLKGLIPGGQRNTPVGNCSKSMLNSYNNQITNFHTRGTYYTGMLMAELQDIQTTFWLKYGTRNSQSIMTGCTGYDYQYTIAEAETNVSRVKLTTAQANNLVVGSSVSIGDNLTTPTSYDRVNGYVHRYADSATITSIEAIDSTYSYVNLDCDPFTSTATTFLKTMPWRSGSSDNILGRDGSPVNRTNSKSPFIMDGIESQVGAYEVLANAFMDIQNSGYRYDIYSTNDSTELTTNVTTAKTNYDLCSYTMVPTTLNAWNYITEEQMDLSKGVVVNTKAGLSGSSSTTGYCDGTYYGNATSGQREFLVFGNLSLGSYSGVSFLRAYYGLGYAVWDCFSRLSVNALGGS